MNISNFIEPIRRVHDRIRGLVVAACEQRSADDLRRALYDGAGDVIYSIDKVSEDALVESFTNEIAPHEPIVLIGEGLPGGRMTLSAARLARCLACTHARGRARHSIAAIASPMTVQIPNAYSHCMSVTSGKNVVTSGASENVNIVANGVRAKESIDPARFNEILLNDATQQRIAICERLAGLLTLRRIVENARIDSLHSPGVEERCPVNEFAELC